MPAMLRPWRGSVLSKRGKLVLQVRDAAGRWRQRATGILDTPEGRVAAGRLLAELRTGLKAREDVGQAGPVTVEGWGARWLRGRAGPDAKNDTARLRLHVYPVIGGMALDEVRPRHLVELVDRLRGAGRAPRTVRNVYSVVKALFRDARIADLLTAPDPCILTHRQMGKVRDSPGFRRAEAVFGADELAALVTDERIPQDRRVWYALLGLGMLRHGEMAGLRWRAVHLEGEPLGALDVVTSYDLGRTKARRSRQVPIHPSLRPLLAAWRLSGWAARYGRPPTDEDLVLPRPRDLTRTRSHQGTHRLLELDLRRLELRRRHPHGLRRTGVSLALSRGADRARLRWVTHGRPGDVLGAYTTMEWEAVCEQVLAIPAVARHGTTVVPYPALGRTSAPPSGRAGSAKSAKRGRRTPP